MKSSSRKIRGLRPDQAFSLGLVLGTLLFGAVGLEAWASPELDRKYALKKVGVLKSWDNVDGLFSDYVTGSFEEWFKSQSRFEYVDLSKATSVLETSKLSYLRLIDDPDVVWQAVRSVRAETVVRTKAWKEGSRYRFKIDWMLGPKLELIATETFILEEPADGKALSPEALKHELQGALDRMVKKVPFQGSVTGRDGNMLTLDIGRDSGIHPGDTVVVATLDDARKHPLLGTIVEWKTSETGSAVIETVDEGVSFAKVSEELKGRSISRNQKILQIRQGSVPRDEPVVDEDKEEAERLKNEPPRLGWISGGLWIGTYSRQYAASATSTSGTTGTSLFMGGKADYQLWLNREFFGELDLAYGFSGFQPKDLASGASVGQSFTATALQTRLAAGYHFFAQPDSMGSKGAIRLGYQTVSHSMPTSTANGTGPTTFKGLFLGLQGDLPLRAGWGALMSLDFGLFTSATADTYITSAVSSASAVNFFVGGYYRVANRMNLRMGVDLASQSADFASGQSINHKILSFGPSLQYFF